MNLSTEPRVTDKKIWKSSAPKKKRTYTRKPKPEVHVPLVMINLTFGETTLMSEGKTVEEAMEKLDVPMKITQKGFLHVQQGDKSFDRMFMPVQMRRFLYPIARTYVAKAITVVLK